MSTPLSRADLHRWCLIPVDDLVGHPERKIPLRVCDDGAEMAALMAKELVEEIKAAATAGRPLRAVIPCGPSGWYKPFTDLVNQDRVNLHHLVVFHMDECLDWQGRPLPKHHPYSFQGFMEDHFYSPVDSDLQVPVRNRHWLTPSNLEWIADELATTPADLVYGGWGQDGHVAYNQARRNPYSPLTVEELRSSSTRIQENNPDTIIALAQRTLGSAYQFVPPMSVTLGMKQILSAGKIRLFSDTGNWKQTALRVGLFSDVIPEYPLTLLQEHPDVLLTATRETAEHPISLHPEWDLGI